AFGYFLSQEGEWDSNGQALWMYARFSRLTGRRPKDAWRRAIHHGANWIRRKRTSPTSGKPHAGLLPAGFSAEHLGPNDFYYWDDFWAVAGLEEAAWMMQQYGDTLAAEEFASEAMDLRRCIDRSLEFAARRLGRPALPASPYRRLDAGAVGSLIAGYPLQLVEPTDPRLLDTAQFLIENCFVNGAFFQDMIH